MAHGDLSFRVALVASTIAVACVKRKLLAREIHLHHVRKVLEPLNLGGYLCFHSATLRYASRYLLILL